MYRRLHVLRECQLWWYRGASSLVRHLAVLWFTCSRRMPIVHGDVPNNIMIRFSCLKFVHWNYLQLQVIDWRHQHQLDMLRELCDALYGFKHVMTRLTLPVTSLFVSAFAMSCSRAADVVLEPNIMQHKELYYGRYSETCFCHCF